MYTKKNYQFSINIGIKLMIIIDDNNTLISQPATSLLSRFYPKLVKLTVKYAMKEMKVSFVRSI